MENTRTFYKVADLPEAERPVNRIREAGPQAVSNAELLACILQTGDALNQANALLAEMGGLAGLARAEQCMFDEIPGIGKARAARIEAAIELGRRIAATPARDMVQVQQPDDAAAFLMPLLRNLEQENFVVLFLDTRNHIFDQEVLYKGTLNCSTVRISEVFRGATRRNCASIIVSHNHPSGDPSPSPEDIALTRKLVSAGELIQIAVLDHLIIGQGRFISLRERGLGFEGN